MASIEEAYQGIFRAGTDMRLLEREANADTVAKVEARLNVAARALALAVLDDEHSTLRRCNCITWAEGDRCRDYKASRARIEALGKEG